MNFARALATSFLAMCIFAASAAWSQTYPSHPITMIVPYPPGGATDTIARVIQDAMAKSLGQPIVVENVGGAGGMIAAAKAARAAPDGYTILIHQVALAAGVWMYKDLSFDAVKDFASIGPINTAASTLAVRGNLPANNFAEFLAWAKQPGRNIKIGHAGVGSYSHLAGVLVAQELGLTVTQVAYRGGGPALVDLLSGQVDLESQTAVVAGALVKSGKLKAYAVIGRKRYAGLPDLPTMGELGYKKLDIDFWHSLLAPANTPRPIIEKLNVALRAALVDPRVVKTFTDGGMDIFPAGEQTPEYADDLLKREIRMWGEVIRANHIAM
ncbi:MAG TPA: tripartite tricarboxylate transporter substrate binding protein [Xanthobacteraceae bacterium]|jgi:tripartite-type tricarboxylate transporter receptor subunit TctC